MSRRTASCVLTIPQHTLISTAGTTGTIDPPYSLASGNTVTERAAVITAVSTAGALGCPWFGDGGVRRENGRLGVGDVLAGSYTTVVTAVGGVC